MASFSKRKKRADKFTRHLDWKARMNFRDVLLRLVEPLYQTLLEPQGWQKFLSMLSRSIEPASIAVHLDDSEGRCTSLDSGSAFDTGDQRIYEETYVALNLLLPPSVIHTARTSRRHHDRDALPIL